MLKRLVNELRCSLNITTTGPVLVKSGHASVTGPDMTPVRTYRNNDWEVYLPGSSLKGVIRSHIEKVCRTLIEDSVCNPFVKSRDIALEQNNQLVCQNYSDVACGDKFELREKIKMKVRGHEWYRPSKEQLSNEQVYHDSCPVCRLFGSTSFIGRLSIGDGYLTTPGTGRTETRDGVGIDRFTGGAAHGAKFELEAVSTGVTFKTDILLRNFECWQLGMLMIVIADLRDKLVHVGSGRSRGLGSVTGQLSELSIHTLAPTPGRLMNEVWGLGRFHSDAERQAYGTFSEDSLIIANLPQDEARGLRRVVTFTNNNIAALEVSARDAFIDRLNTWPIITGMQWHNDWRRG